MTRTRPTLALPNTPTEDSMPSTTTDTPAWSMSDADYLAAMEQVSAAVRYVRLLPVKQLLAVVDRAETLGPILEPTAYMRGGNTNLRDQRDVLTALAEVQRVAERLAGPIGGDRG